MSQNFFTSEGTNLTKFNEDPEKKGFALLDNQMAVAQKTKEVLQVYSIVISIVVFLLAVALLVGFTNKKLVPVIVTVNNEGEAKYVGTVDKALYNKRTVPETAKTRQIKNLIKFMNTIFTDKNAQNDYIKEAQNLVQRDAINQLDIFFRENNPFNDFGEYTQNVEIQEPLKQNEKTYFVNYTVTKKQNGFTVYQEDYTILVNIDYYESVPETNPLGIFITNFNIQKVK